jgi:hypothetical protein
MALSTVTSTTADSLHLGARVRAGRDAYLAQNGFTVAAYDAKWLIISVLGLPIPTPITKRRAWALRAHDLHHVATGYGTDYGGEAEITAWELRRGLSGLGAYVGGIVVLGAVLGLAVAPVRTLRAFRSSGASSRSLYRTARSYDELLEMPITQLRSELGIPVRGLVQSPQGLHADAPSRHEQTVPPPLVT